MSKLYRWLSILGTLLLLLTACSPTTSTKPTKPAPTKPEKPSAASNTPSTTATTENTAAEVDYQGMTITMLDVGQGLAILFEADGHRMLYDGGGRDSSSYVVTYLREHNCTDIDLLIASHYDVDHIAGLIGCMKQFTVSQVLCPDYTAGSAIYNSFIRTLKNNDAQCIHPSPGETYTLGNAAITILGPEEYLPDVDNNNSIAVLVEYGEFRCLLDGDAEQAEEEELIASGVDLDVDLYVAAHHGSRTSSGDAILTAMSPTAVWISCGDGNSYGHPAQSTMTRLEKHNADIYRTDKQGEIQCYSDGRTYSFSKSPCIDHSSGEYNPSDSQDRGDINSENTQDSDADASGYVLNTGSMKFHRPSCQAVTKISRNNRQDVDPAIDRDELIAQGYDPCGICNP